MTEETKVLSDFDLVEKLAIDCGLFYFDKLDNQCWNTNATTNELVELCNQFMNQFNSCK